MDCSPQCSSVHEISKARILEWVAIFFSGNLPNPGIKPTSPAWQTFFITEPLGTGGGDGNLFEQAVEFAIADGQISTSTLQRRLKIGYARAGRLTDEMEERGIVAAKDGSKPRKCLITREEWEAMKQATEGMT